MTKIKIKFLLIALFLFGMFIMPILSHAASEIMLQEGDVQTETIPQNPEPYQAVTVNLVSYATDLNKAMIQWKIGPKVVLSGYGKTSYSFTASGPNTTTVFTIIITPSGSLVNVVKRVLIIPSDVDILWEAPNSYTPPFYRGKAFVSREGIIKVVAIPNTDDIKKGKGNITYTWSLNDKTKKESSGYNKNSYIFQNDVLNRTEDISVIASSVDGNYNATKRITISTVSPKMVFYKKSPTRGILYNQALIDGFLMSGPEMTIVAAPYFLSVKGNESDLNYLWQVNGKAISTPSNRTELTVRPISRGGYATISLTIQNMKTLFQTVVGQLKINL